MAALDQYALLIGFDTEWVFGPVMPDAPPSLRGRQCPKCAAKGPGNWCPPRRRSQNRCNPPGNAILSYQAALVGMRTGLKGSGTFYTESPHGVANRRYFRSYAAHMVRTAFDAGIIGPEDIRDETKGRGENRRVVGRSISVMMVAHFSRAEISAFADFSTLKTKFDAVRGAFVTVQQRDVHQVSVRLSDGTSLKVKIRLMDSWLLAPAGSKLEKLGSSMNIPKLSVPDVTTETGETVPGITRMDLVLRDHPEDYRAYAERDAVVSVEWMFRVARICDDLGIDRIPPTMAAIGVARLKQVVEETGLDKHWFFGRVKPDRGEPEYIPEVADFNQLAADSYHGGLNTAHVVGIFDAGQGVWTDLDLRGAYTTAMACFRQPAWRDRVYTLDLDDLAILDGLSCARVTFRFPGGVDPCLPVATGDYGLIYPREGTTFVGGPELYLARQMGAELDVGIGVFVPWEDTNGPRPFVQFSREINEARRHYKNSALSDARLLAELAGENFDDMLKIFSPEEQLMKGCGNGGGYGKIAQGVSGMKSAPKLRRLLNTRTGQNEIVPQSSITVPIYAAYITSLVRAVLCEIIWKLSDHVNVLTITTDGWLSDATLGEARAAATGDVATFFGDLRAMVDPDGDRETLEVKHVSKSVLVMKTRGTVTVEPAPADEIPAGTSSWILARAGHKLEEPAETDAEECSQWVRYIRSREYGDKMMRRSLVPLRDQYFDDRDLTEDHREVSTNMDFDFKRKPVNVRDYDGLIQCNTVAWKGMTEFYDWRESWDKYRKATGSVLRTADDWYRFVAWRESRTFGTAALRSHFQNMIEVAAARGLCGFDARTEAGAGDTAPGMTRRQRAELLLNAGIPGVTMDTLKKLSTDATDPIGAVTRLADGDADVLKKLAETIPKNLLNEVFGDGVLPIKNAALPQICVELGLGKRPSEESYTDQEVKDETNVYEKSGLKTRGGCIDRPDYKTGNLAPAKGALAHSDDGVTTATGSGHAEPKLSRAQAAVQMRTVFRISKLQWDRAARKASKIGSGRKPPLGMVLTNALVACRGVTAAEAQALIRSEIPET